MYPGKKFLNELLNLGAEDLQFFIDHTLGKNGQNDPRVHQIATNSNGKFVDEECINALDRAVTQIVTIAANQPLIHYQQPNVEMPALITGSIDPEFAQQLGCLPLIKKEYPLYTNLGQWTSPQLNRHPVVGIAIPKENGKEYRIDYLDAYIRQLARWEPFGNPYANVFHGGNETGVLNWQQLINSFRVLGLLPEDVANAAVRALIAINSLIVLFHQHNSHFGGITSTVQQTLLKSDAEFEDYLRNNSSEVVKKLLRAERHRIKRIQSATNYVGMTAAAVGAIDPNTFFMGNPVFGFGGMAGGMANGMGVLNGMSFQQYPNQYPGQFPGNGQYIPGMPQTNNPGGQYAPQQQNPGPMFQANPYGTVNPQFMPQNMPYGGAPNMVWNQHPAMNPWVPQYTAQPGYGGGHFGPPQQTTYPQPPTTVAPVVREAPIDIHTSPAPPSPSGPKAPPAPVQANKPPESK